MLASQPASSTLLHYEKAVAMRSTSAVFLVQVLLRVLSVKYSTDAFH
jgi:hypothetical protein